MLRGAHLTNVGPQVDYSINGRLAPHHSSFSCAGGGVRVSITDQKAALRKGLIGARPAEPPTAAQYDHMAQALRQKLPADAFQMTAYLPIRRELDPLPLINRLSAFPVALPRTPSAPGPLDFRLWSVGEPLDEGLFNGSPGGATSRCVLGSISSSYLDVKMAGEPLSFGKDLD